MTMTMSRTGWTLGDAEELSSRAEARSSHHTPLREVMDSSLGSVLEVFDASFSRPLAVLRLLHHGSCRPTGPIVNADRWLESLRVAVDEEPSSIELWTSAAGTAAGASAALSVSLAEQPSQGSLDAAEAIEQLSAQLSLPVRDVCRAAGVSKSAFYTWTKPDGPRPRVASQGRLWGLTQFSEDLLELLGSSASAWLSEPGRRRLFRAGRFDDLLELVRSNAGSEQTAPQHAHLLYVGGDRLASDSEPAALRRGSARPAQVTAAIPRSRRPG